MCARPCTEHSNPQCLSGALRGWRPVPPVRAGVLGSTQSAARTLSRMRRTASRSSCGARSLGMAWPGMAWHGLAAIRYAVVYSIHGGSSRMAIRIGHGSVCVDLSGHSAHVSSARVKGRTEHGGSAVMPQTGANEVISPSCSSPEAALRYLRYFLRS